MYTQVNVSQINQMINDGVLVPLQAIKDKNVRAIELTQEVVNHMIANGGYQTVVLDEKGRASVETTNKKLNAGDWLVTNQIATHDNSYVVSSEKFFKLYEKTNTPDVYKPISGVRTAYKIPQDMNLEFEAPWGGMMKIRSGGVLVADGDKFYGINPEEFVATYSIVQ